MQGFLSSGTLGFYCTKNNMEIKKYSKADESLLFDLLVDEGDEWSDYHGV